LGGQPITVYGDGSQRRCFAWVGDVVRASIALIQEPAAFGEVFNIGDTNEISVYQLALLVKELARSGSEIVAIPYEQAYEPGFEDMPRRLPDIGKIQQRIGYRPTLQLEDMLEQIITYERNSSLSNGRQQEP